MGPELPRSRPCRPDRASTPGTAHRMDPASHRMLSNTSTHRSVGTREAVRSRSDRFVTSDAALPGTQASGGPARCSYGWLPDRQAGQGDGPPAVLSGSLAAEAYAATDDR